ncbi:hypothetical protein NRK68_32350 [Streptomyces yangpuensis]|uniref:Uncharacterized protein n=1 Tax=Streptomyces yangpuensis TaxID=1648182 RepID=A0ABY5Q510_9ACTN|nr:MULTISPECIES: hypothetical protein [Streptomyces]UUY51522.1 hypothetical protein NRK68_32350 [Streptomyces yangpuensis]
MRALARRMLAGELKPWELTFRIHRRYGHELPLPVMSAPGYRPEVLQALFGPAVLGGGRA